MQNSRKTPFEEPYIAIIDSLVRRRKQIGVSQIELAAALGYDQSFVSRIERRQRRLDVWEFVRFCRALELNPGDVLDPQLNKAD
ncbi:helix-turn-helix transcriptional regulator [Sphingomonas suaedae]|uniref:Helix-turn-helix transcriptional regulator n=1 Tax=Sphingomonas suaedae TaxID=2599297 RepID=A0A518RKY8_9SPHN|nr:helix-turn-helix transcriptional regulator [Sphingomonas suaedae]QDX28099.1 helix-turn-helix transcriptional regulator [Sphingomonas suaedae]